jgi:flagellar basal-body rod modification protein FlgD
MAVGNVQNPSTLAQATPTTQSSTASAGAIGKDDFMKLLIAQLKNQDPSSPADPKDFVTQLSQLTGVEQMTNMANQLSALQTATTSMVANQASGLVGKRIEADGKTLYLGDQGPASTSYNLSANAKTVEIKVYDAAGNNVHAETVDTVSVGQHEFKWDGNNDQGVRGNPGSYTIAVSATDANGKNVIADTTISGAVTKVSYERGFPELYVGSATVALANVKTISN